MTCQQHLSKPEHSVPQKAFGQFFGWREATITDPIIRAGLERRAHAIVFCEEVARSVHAGDREVVTPKGDQAGLQREGANQRGGGLDVWDELGSAELHRVKSGTSFRNSTYIRLQINVADALNQLRRRWFTLDDPGCRKMTSG